MSKRKVISSPVLHIGDVDGDWCLCTPDGKPLFCLDGLLDLIDLPDTAADIHAEASRVQWPDCSGLGVYVRYTRYIARYGLRPLYYETVWFLEQLGIGRRLRPQRVYFRVLYREARHA